jgi:hypothetical protein
MMAIWHIVAREYTFSALTSDWKANTDFGIRAMVAGGAVRFNIAVSDEGASVWFMAGQPF